MADNPSADNRTADIVVDLDHVTTVLPDRPARQLFSGLGRLGLFVAWPYADYGPLWTGGIRLGNLNLEVIGVAGESRGGRAGPGDGPGEPGAVQAGGGEAGPAEAGPAEAGPAEAGPAEAGPAEAGPAEAGLGPWPRQVLTLAPASLADLAGELDQRGVRHGDPAPFPPLPDGESLCTTMDLPDLSGDTLAVRFCAYPDGPRTQTVAPRDLAGVQHVERVVLGTSDIGAARERWAALLAPEGAAAAGAENGPVTVWQPGYGPALELRPAAADAVLELVLRVRSLPVARAAFTAAGLSVSGDAVTLGTLPARLVSG